MSNKIYANEVVLKENFHTGEFIKDEIDARGMKQQDLADKMGIAKNVLSEIIHGKRNLTPILALKLEKALGINAEFWMKIQINYEINLIRNQYNSLIGKTNASPAKRTRLAKAINKTSRKLFNSKKYSTIIKEAKTKPTKKK